MRGFVRGWQSEREVGARLSASGWLLPMLGATMLKRKRLRLPDPRTQVLAAALCYAAQGWPVLPCKPVDKTPLAHHGFKDATTDPDQIQAWWRHSPDAMIGVGCGERIAQRNTTPRNRSDKQYKTTRPTSE